MILLVKIILAKVVNCLLHTHSYTMDSIFMYCQWETFETESIHPDALGWAYTYLCKWKYDRMNQFRSIGFDRHSSISINLARFRLCHLSLICLSIDAISVHLWCEA